MKYMRERKELKRTLFSDGHTNTFYTICNVERMSPLSDVSLIS